MKNLQGNHRARMLIIVNSMAEAADGIIIAYCSVMLCTHNIALAVKANNDSRMTIA